MNQLIADYFKTQPVVKAWLFGSYSRGEQKPWSDVDILVEMDENQPIGLLKFAGIICDLEDLTGHKIDLVEEGTLKPFAVESVNRDKKLIYAREKQRPERLEDIRNCITIETAQRLKAMGKLSDEQIAEATGLTLRDVERI